MARFRTWVGIALAGALSVSLAGCSSTGGKRAEDARKAASAEGRAAVNTPRWTFAMITHSGDGDTFWDIVQSGAEQAAVKDNINFLYSHDDEAQQQAQLVDAAIDKKVDGIIVSLAKPDAMKSALARAKKAGIPVVTVNSGSAESKKFGALTHIGQDETIAGEAVGEELNERGRKQAICVLHEQGNVGHEQRCDGVEKTFDGKVQRLYVTGTSMPDVQPPSRPTPDDKAVDAVVTLGAPYADSAVRPSRAPAARSRSAPSTSTPRWPPASRTAPARRRPEVRGGGPGPGPGCRPHHAQPAPRVPGRRQVRPAEAGHDGGRVHT
ncbi:hypothetical protein STENM223S_08934 [Streptomyces tendae]